MVGLGATETFDVVILAFDDEREASPASELQRVFGIDEESAVRLVASLPMTVQRRVPRVRAEYFRRALAKIGAMVEVRDGDGEVIAAPVEARSAPPDAASPSQAPPAADLDPARAHAALRQTIADGGAAAPGAAPAPRHQAANETLREAMPAPVAAAAAAAAAAASAATAVRPRRAEPTAFEAPAGATSASAPPPHPATATVSEAPSRWQGTSELEAAASWSGEPVVRAPMAHMRSDVFDPPPAFAATTDDDAGITVSERSPSVRPAPTAEAMRSATTDESWGADAEPPAPSPDEASAFTIERHRHEEPSASGALDLGAPIPMADKWELGDAQDDAPAAPRDVEAARAPIALLDLEDVAAPATAGTRAADLRPPPPLGHADGQSTLEDLPSPLAHPAPPPAATRRAAHVGEAAPVLRSNPAADARDFWESFGSALRLPFTGPGSRWLLTIFLWSAVVGVLGWLIAGVPLIGPFVIFFLNASLLALVCDYFRVNMWVAATGEGVLDRTPNLDPVHVFEIHMKQGTHTLLFLTASQLFALWWIGSRAMDDAPMSAIVGDFRTWALLVPPAFYWPMAVTQTALRNDFGGIWNVPAGIKTLLRAPVQYTVLCAVGALVFLMAFGITGPLGKILGSSGALLSVTLGIPMALSHGIMGALTGHLARAEPHAFEE